MTIIPWRDLWDIVGSVGLLVTAVAAWGAGKKAQRAEQKADILFQMLRQQESFNQVLTARIKTLFDLIVETTQSLKQKT